MKRGPGFDPTDFFLSALLGLFLSAIIWAMALGVVAIIIWLVQ